MDSFRSYVLRLAYRKVERLGDRLARVEGLIDWEAFRPIVAGLYRNDGPKGGRPNGSDGEAPRSSSTGTASATPSWNGRSPTA